MTVRRKDRWLWRLYNEQALAGRATPRLRYAVISWGDNPIMHLFQNSRDLAFTISRLNSPRYPGRLLARGSFQFKTREERNP